MVLAAPLVFWCCCAPPDLRPPRGLPAREPSALRASLGASSRSPARPRRPRGGLQSGEACGCEWPALVRPPARLGVLTLFGAAPRIPPVPSGPSGALHTSGAGTLFGSSTRRLEAQPGPAAAHGRRSLALRTLRRPPHLWGRVAVRQLYASSRSPARPRHSPRASQISRVKPPSPLRAQGEPQMKPASPLLACTCMGLKPVSPLRVRNGCIRRVFWLQW